MLPLFVYLRTASLFRRSGCNLIRVVFKRGIPFDRANGGTKSHKEPCGIPAEEVFNANATPRWSNNPLVSLSFSPPLSISRGAHVSTPETRVFVQLWLPYPNQILFSSLLSCSTLATIAYHRYTCWSLCNWKLMRTHRNFSSAFEMLQWELFSYIIPYNLFFKRNLCTRVVECFDGLS